MHQRETASPKSTQYTVVSSVVGKLGDLPSRTRAKHLYVIVRLTRPESEVDGHIISCVVQTQGDLNPRILEVAISNAKKYHNHQRSVTFSGQYRAKDPQCDKNI